jgi:hypothetical protein
MRRAQARRRTVVILTPIVKALLTELANECAYHALQIFGGHGYIREAGMEQYARDARITTIYEGTTQIQALDLLGRKVMQTQGVGLKHFLEEISAFCHAQAQNPPWPNSSRHWRSRPRNGRPDPGDRQARSGQSGRDWCRRGRLSVLFRLRGVWPISGHAAWPRPRIRASRRISNRENA